MANSNAGTVGLYLEFGSRDNVIKDSVFVGMVFARLSPIVKPSRWTHRNNRIENNQFIHNGAGSILLIATALSMPMTRRAAIISNALSRVVTILFAVMSFKMSQWAQWVASRQSRNLKGFEWRDGHKLFASYHLDSAKDNQIINNQFTQVEQGVIVEDDGTLIRDNTFAADVRLPIQVGSKFAKNCRRASQTYTD